MYFRKNQDEYSIRTAKNQEEYLTFSFACYTYKKAAHVAVNRLWRKAVVVLT